MTSDANEALIHLARNDSGRVLASLAKRYNDVDLADEAVQEALIEAAQHWPQDGVPSNPGGWLYRVAQRKAVDRLRRDQAAQRRLDGAAHELVSAAQPDHDDRTHLIDDGKRGPGNLGLSDMDTPPTDERLRLMLLCCHPALGVDAQVGLTLRLVGGLTTEEIAAGFLVPTPTLAARITRAKKKIRSANIPLSVPDDLDVRIDALLAVLYLIFNEGYLSRSGAGGDPMRVDLCIEAIRLAEVVCQLAPAHAEAHGLLALLALTHARRDARFQGGKLVLLDDQDRSAWRLDEIVAGNRVLAKALEQMSPAPYQLQALIASQHSNARSAENTDWPRIVALYDQLMAMHPTPIVALNRAVSLAMADGPLSGLRALDTVRGLDGYHLFHSARGELLARAGNTDEARQSLQRAHELTSNPSELEHLLTRLQQLT